MSNKRKTATVGDNQKALLHDYVELVEEQERFIDTARGKIKTALNKAKKDGLLKQAIRGVVKERALTEKQRQARVSVEVEIKHYTELCRDLPLFNIASNDDDSNQVGTANAA